jgi:CRISPR-associated protein Csh2
MMMIMNVEFNDQLKIPIEKSNREKSSITLTGPVQFRFGKSLHKVEPMFIKGTGAFASGKNKGQKTFREEYVVPYSLISFYGIINENAAKHTNLTEDDINKLIDAIWNGTKNLISRSKMGQTPRLLIKVNYKENNYHIGDLDRCIALKSDVKDEEIRSSDDYVVDITKLIDILLKNKDKIENVEYIWDDRLKLTYNDGEFKFDVDGIEFKEIAV